ncbi:MAG: 50S ribosomal protein L30 [Clostridia bacterium]|nr:50S ribosomal protein L30 [Clostridia bacterium]MBP5269695.1 50S ribosomal protein L30 [Clostridia bacterium]
MKKVTLVKSLITCKPNQKATADSLGLRKIGDSVIHAEGPVLDGKVRIISHLVKVEDCDCNGKENA